MINTPKASAAAKCGIKMPPLAAATSAATMGMSQTAVMFSMLWSCLVNIRKGTSRPLASDRATSTHQSGYATAMVAASPQSGMPKASKPLTMVARPIGIAPKNIEATPCCKHAPRAAEEKRPACRVQEGEQREQADIDHPKRPARLMQALVQVRKRERNRELVERERQNARCPW